MLPILPVLLLLLFQGPANIERLAMEGRLPAALAAIQTMDAQPGSDHEAIASLLAQSSDPELTQALYTILKWIDRPEAPARPQPIEAESERASPVPDQAETPSDGFDCCRRTRDGPLRNV